MAGKKRNYSQLYDGLKRISDEEGVDFGIDAMSKDEFRKKYFTGPGNIENLYNNLSRISDEEGIDFGQGSRDEWLESFGYRKNPNGRSYTNLQGRHIGRPTQAQPTPQSQKPTTLSPEERQAMARQTQGLVDASGRNVARGKAYLQGLLSKPTFDTEPVKIGAKTNPNVVKQSSFNPETAEMEDTYLTQAGEFESEAMANRVQGDIDREAELMLHPVEGKLDDAYKERDRLQLMLEQRRQQLDDEYNNAGILTKIRRSLSNAARSGIDPSAIADNPETRGYENDEQYMQLMSAIRKNNQTIQLLEDKKSGNLNGFWHTFGNAMASGYYLDDGVSSIRDTQALVNAQKHLDEINRKRKDGEELTQEEEAAEATLRNTLAQEAVEGEYKGDYGAMARAGEMFAGSVDFMKDIMLFQGAEGLAKGIYSKVANIGAGALAREAGGSLAKELPKALARGTLKATGMVLGAHGAGALVANTTAINRMGASVGEKMAGKVGIDESGNYEITDSQGAMSALLDAEREGAREYGSEMAGMFIPSVGKYIPKALEKIGLSRISSGLQQIGTKQWYRQYSQLIRSGGFNGVPGEALEEYEGNLFDALTGNAGEAYRELSDPQYHLDIWLGCATMSGVMGFFPMVGTGAHIGQYYRYKHNLNKADNIASASMGDKWQAIRDDIDYYTNEEMPNAVRFHILLNDELTDEQKAIALDYVRNLQKFRGYNIAQADNAQPTETMSQEDEDENELNNSYGNGYDISEPADKNKAKELYDLRLQTATEVLGESTVEMLDDNPMPTLLRLRERGEEAEIRAALDYVNAKYAYDGMIDRVKDDIDVAQQQADYMIRRRTNFTTLGEPTIIPVITQQGKRMYITDGEVTALEDGSIDLTNSNDDLIAVDKEGNVSFLSAKDIKTVEEQINPAQALEETRNNIAQELSKKEADEIDGVLPFLPNDVYQGADEQGTPLQITILQDNGDGNVIANVTGLGEGVTLPKQTIQSWVDGLRMANLQQEEAERLAQYEPAEEYDYEQGANVDDYEPVEDYSEYGENGNEYEEYEQPFDGVTQAEAQAEAEQYQANRPAMEKIPVLQDAEGNPILNKKGRPQYQWTQAPVETTADALSDLNDGILVDARDTAQNMRKQADEKLQKVKAQKVKGDDPIEEAESRKEIRNQVQAAQNEVDYWKNVTQEINRRMSAESARIQAEIEAKKTQEQKEAEEAERKRIAAELDAKEREAIRKEIEKDGKKRNEPYKPLTEAKKEMADDDEAMSILNDTEPRDLAEWVSSLIKPHSMLWQDENGQRGLQSELGLNRSDIQKFISLLAQRDNGGKPFAEVVDEIYSELPDAMKTQYTDQDVRNTLLDLFNEGSVQRMRNLAEEHRIEEARAQYEYNRRREEEAELQAWADAFHLSPEERESFEAWMEEDTPIELSDEELAHIINIIDEQENEQSGGSQTMGEKPNTATENGSDKELSEPTETTTTEEHGQGIEGNVSAGVSESAEPIKGEDKGYTITPSKYTTKRGKELDMQLVTFDSDLTKEQKRAADKFARDKKGWFDRAKNGYMMRSEADAEELAKLVGNDAAVQEAQPISLADIQNVTDEAEGRPKEESKPKVTLGFGTQATGANDKTNAIRIFQNELDNIINKKRGYANQFKKFDEFRKKYGWKKYADFDLYAVFDDNGNFIGFSDNPRGAYDIALNNDLESFMVVRQQPTDEGIEYNATYGWLFTNDIPDSEWRDDKGVLREEVKQKATYSIARNLPDVKTTETTEQPQATEILNSNELTDEQFNEVLSTELYKSEDNPSIGYSKTISMIDKGYEILRKTVFIDGKPIGTHLMTIPIYNIFAAVYKNPTETWHINLFVSSYDKNEDKWNPIDGQDFYDDVQYFGNFKSEEDMISFYKKNKDEIERRKANAEEAEKGRQKTPQQEQPKEQQKPPKSMYVSDEDAERFAQLKERLRQKLLGQMNMGIDPEIFTLGVEMTYMIVKNQARKFADYAKAMIEEMGDAIRPYLKAFYNGARELPELEDVADELTPYEEVRVFDVTNFDKEGEKDLIKTAEVVVKEDDANNQAETAKEKITQGRNEKQETKDTDNSQSTDAENRLAQLREKYPDRVLGEQHEDRSVTFHDKDAILVGELLGREVEGDELTLSSEDVNKALQKLIANGHKVGLYEPIKDETPKKQLKITDVTKPQPEPKQEQPTLQLTNEQEEKPKKPRTSVSSKGKIEDVGEKIGGARKDIVQATVDRININGETFSKIFPKFDYHKLIKEGLDPKLAAGLSHVAQIAKDEYKRRKRRLGEQRALSMARFYANYAKGYLLGDTSLDFSNEGWVFTEYGKNVIGFGIEAWERLYDALGEDMFDIDLSGFEVGYIMKQDNANIKNFYYRDGERIDARYGIRAGQTKYFTEDEKEEALQYLVDGVKKAISYKASHPFKLGAYYTPGVKDSEYIGAKIGGKVIQLTPKGKEYGLKYLDEHNAELQLLAQRKAEELKEEKKNNKQTAQVVVISGQTSYKKKFAVKIGGKYVDLSDEMYSFETSDYTKKHLEEMQAKAQELLDEYNKEHGDGKGWKPEMNIGGQRKRVGKDWREGRDVSATELMNKFGFRGVEFGNYVTQKERQRLINECYDAFMDMADVLGVSPRALSLNGNLGMAIGARGIGGAVAHYEPAKNVINLTKKNGWGALAHEWWHSLDYYFGQREKAKSATASYFKEGVRKEMKEAFEKVMDRIKGSDYLKRSRSLDRKTNKDYYSKDTELGARAFQDYIEKKLTERGQVNDFLSHFTTKEDWNGERETYPYPIEEEGQKIGDAFESFFDTIQEREDEETGNTILFREGEDEELQDEQIHSQSFKGWFGDWENEPENASKVVDENGRPLVVYRGADFNPLEQEEGNGVIKPMRYFTPDESYANRYGKTNAYYLNIRHPFDIRNKKDMEIYKSMFPDYYEVVKTKSGAMDWAEMGAIDWDEFMEAHPEYDGLIVDEGADPDASEQGYKHRGISYVPLHGGTQVKSATANSGAFSNESEDVRMRTTDTLPFYSNAARAVEQVKQDKATPEQWLKMIEKNGGLKSGEDKWIGLSDWLKASKAKSLTKQEVMDYIRSNQIQIEETEYAENVDNSFDDEIIELWHYASGNNYDKAEEVNARMIEKYGEDFRKAAEVWYDGSLRVYDQALLARIKNGEDAESPINETRLSYTTQGLENKREIALTVPTIESWNTQDEVHFGDAGQGRAVAWVRFGETTDADGNRVLVIDEIQSKRHQEGREKGYKPSEKEVKDARAKWTEKAKERDDYFNELCDKYNADTIDEVREKATKEEFEKYQGLLEEAKALDIAYSRLAAAPITRNNTIPAAPFEKNWHELAMKRMLRYAAENGYDKVAWTTGEQQAERYDIGDKIKDISISVASDPMTGEPLEGKYDVFPHNHNNHTIMVDGAAGLMDKEQVLRVYGKDLGQRMIDAADKAGVDGDVLSGNNLRIGGEGMKGFYDEILPRFMNKYGKKWGAKVGTVELPNVEESARTMWAVDVTPEMKDSVMQGQPMFRQTQQGSAQRTTMQAIRQAINDIIDKLHIADRVTVLESTEGLKGKKARAKGWFDVSTGKIVVVLPNNRNAADAMRTILHEGVAHFGLRELFGKNFDEFLQDVYSHSSESVRNKIDANAKKRGWSKAEATEEYLASLAETQNFEQAKKQGIWNKVKEWFNTMLNKVGIPKLFTTSYDDNELRYILWRSWRNLTENGNRDYLGMAEDIVKREDLGVGEFAMHRDKDEYDPRSSVPKVRGGWTENKILRYLKEYGSLYGRRNAFKLIAEFDDIDELKEHMFWHGSTNAPINMKPSMTRSERWAEQYGGGGYGDRYWGVSLTKNKYTATNFSGTRRGISVYPVILAKNANVETLPEADDAAYVEGDVLIDLWTRGVDAVWIGDKNKGEQELLVLNPRAIVNTGESTYYEVFGLRKDKVTTFNDEQIQNMLDVAKEQVESPFKKGEPKKPSKFTPDYKQRKPQEQYEKEMAQYEEDLKDYWNSQRYKDDLAKDRELSESIRFKEQQSQITPEQDANEDNRFREDEEIEPTSDVARTVYDSVMSDRKKHIQEAWQDGMISIKEAQDAVLDTDDKPLRSYEDAYQFENHMHGISRNEAEYFERNLFKPLLQAINTLAKKSGKTANDVYRYLMLKHGLERNRVFAERDARREFETEIAKLEAMLDDNTLTNAQRTAIEKRIKIERAKFDGLVNHIADPDVKAYYDQQLRTIGTLRANGQIDEEEYNKRMANLSHTYLHGNKDSYKWRDYSGLMAVTGADTLDEAERLANEEINDMESLASDETKELWQAVNAATQWTLRKSFDSGEMTRDNYEAIKSMFKYYVPLRGWAETRASDVYDYMGGKGEVFSPVVRNAFGRMSEADNPIAYIGNMAVSAIVGGNKNLLKQHLLRFAQNHPNALFTVSEQWYQNTGTKQNPKWVAVSPDIPENATAEQIDAAIKQFDEDMAALEESGMATKKKGKLKVNYPEDNARLKEHQVRVRVNGREYVIYVNGNPRVAQAINGKLRTRARENSYESSKMANINRVMAQNFTSRNPAFIFSNASRDLNMAMAVVGIKEGWDYNKKFYATLGRVVFRPRAVRGGALMPMLMGLYLDGKIDGYIADTSNDKDLRTFARYFKEFMTNGGETGFTSLRDVDTFKKTMQKEYGRMQQGKADPRKLLRQMGEGFEYVNRCVEDMTRFVTYATSRQMGRSIADSVTDAKNVTLNFNRKGSGGMYNATFRNFYIFVNPAIQSLHLLWQLASDKRTRKAFTVTTLSFATAGALMPIVNAAIYALTGGGDDDDYWNLPTWVRRNNICFKFPHTGSFITIPLAQEFRVFYGLGELVASALLGHPDKNAALSATEQVTDLLPISFTGANGNLAVNLSPTLLQPIMQVSNNVDFTGKPIRRITPFNENEPAFQKAYRGTPSWMVKSSELINDLTGGNEHSKGWIEGELMTALHLNYANDPAVVNHILKGYFGGMYSFISGTTGLATTALSGEMPKSYEVPILNRFLNIPLERTERGSIVLGEEYYGIKNEMQKYQDEVRGFERDAKKGDIDARRIVEDMRNSDKYKHYKLTNRLINKIEDVRNKAKYIPYESARENANIVMGELYDKLRKVDALTDEEAARLTQVKDNDEFNEIFSLPIGEMKKRLSE